MLQQPSFPPSSSEDLNTKGIVGIQNMGNTCYCNSTLQLIRACPEWNVFCLTENLIEKVQHLPEDNPNRRILLAYQDILRSLWSAHFPAYVRPVGFLTEVQKAVMGTPYEMFGIPVPNDSHEYLVYLLDHFHEAMRTSHTWIPEVIPEDASSEEKMRIMARNGWNKYLSKNNSPVVQFFFGMLRKTIQCLRCSLKTYQWEVFNSLKIPCDGHTFEEWIQKEANETTEIDGYRCDGCKEKVTAKLMSHLWKLPSHLFITLRRFHANGQKNMITCPYQGGIISMTSFFAEESDSESRDWTYEIRGVSDHHGTHMGGHYTAQFKHPLTGQWWLIDDQKAQQMESPRFTSSNYIFYFRRNPSKDIIQIE